jgi:hypothetical protein
VAVGSVVARQMQSGLHMEVIQKCKMPTSQLSVFSATEFSKRSTIEFCYGELRRLKGNSNTKASRKVGNVKGGGGAMTACWYALFDQHLARVREPCSECKLHLDALS